MKLAPPRPEQADPGLAPAAAGRETPPLDGSGGGRETRPAGRPRRLVVVLKGVAILFAVAGALALADGVLTLVWQEPISGLLAHFQQARLAENLKRLEGERATAADQRALAGLPTDNQRMAFFARQLQQTARDGQAVGRIRIPRIGADFVVVAGTGESSLQKGPGIYSGTAVPGLRGTVGIAGHRTTYLAPFRRINELAKGDRITVEMPYGLFSYTVLRHQIVSPNDVSVLQRTAYDQVVLTACNPLYSAAQRIVVFARLTASAPAGPALTSSAAAAVRPGLSAGQVADAVLGDLPAAAVEPGGAPPLTYPDEVLLGLGAPATATATPGPARRPARPAARRTAAPRRAASRAGVTRPPSASRPSVRPIIAPPVAVAPRRPAPISPAAPVRPVVRTPVPTPVRRPAATTPPPSRVKTPAAPTPPAAPAPAQTRVQGSPGGPTPIIGVPAGA